MIKLFKLYPETIVSFIIGITVFVVSLFFNLDVFEYFIGFLTEIEHLELDEIIIPSFILMIGILVDIYIIYDKKKKIALIAETRLKYLETIIRTVQDIVGNSMNNLLLYSDEAKNTGTLSKKSINELDSLILSTTTKINALAEAKEINERELGDKMFVLEIGDKNKKT